ncbi:MAG: DNA repair protein RecO [Bacteroidales bacterium]
MSLQTSKGIVLSQVRYSETSLIVKIYTEKFGLASYIFKGVRKSKPSVPPALLQHLSPVEFIVQHQENKTLHFVKEIRSLFPFTSLPFTIKKSSIALFINELLIKSLKEEEPDTALFDFLVTSVQILDLDKGSIQNFHLWFSLQLSRFLGFMPGENFSSEKNYFDLMEGVFQSTQPPHIHYVSAPLHQLFYQFSRPGFRDYEKTVLNNADRRYLLHKITEYYQLHIQGFGQMKSLDILEEVFS